MNKGVTVTNKFAQILKSAADTISREELALINNYTRRSLNSDEVYVFSVVLCDNEIDRDFERFPVESLQILQKLFLGKPGVFDHNPTAENQTARIFKTYIDAPLGQKTETGDDYFRLVARAYLPKSEKNKDFILSLDSGIQKEVSIGCSIEKSICSICGRESGSCEHRRGEIYNNKLCYYELLNPKDAYEWSFVAVPSQRNAGVIKSYSNRKKESNMEEILKSVKNGEAVNLSAEQSNELKNYLAMLENSAAQAAVVKTELCNEVKRLATALEIGISGKTLDSVTKKLSIEELIEYKKAYTLKLNQKHKASLKPQLAAKNDKNNINNKNEFMI